MNDLSQLSGDDLKTYLTHCYDIEKEVYQLKQAVSSYTAKINGLVCMNPIEPVHKTAEADPARDKHHRTKFILCSLLLSADLIFIGCAVWDISSGFSNFSLLEGLWLIMQLIFLYLLCLGGSFLVSVVIPFAIIVFWIIALPAIPIFMLLGQLGYVPDSERVRLEQLELDKKYQQEMEIFAEQMASYEQTLKLKQQYECDLAEIKKALNKNEQLRKDIYSTNTLHIQYHEDFVAISSFLDYLEKGICTELSGPDGVYARFDHEILVKEIIRNLQQIKQNQFRLYNAVQDAASAVQSLVTASERNAIQNERIAESNEAIAHTTEAHRLEDQFYHFMEYLFSKNYN